jgi:glutathione reductase (NADPH)
MDRYDFIVLGGGSAGLSAGRKVKAAGKSVALIDPTPIGGLCALNGCTPKKVLVRAAEVLQFVREAGKHGIRTGEVRIDWSAVIDRKHTFTDPVTNSTEQSLKEADIDYVKAPARFVSVDKLEVEGRTLSFENALLATGSAPRRLSFPGAEHASTSDGILELRDVPGRLVIIGSGVIAFELGHVFTRLGSRVHMLMHGRQPLKRSDAELVARLTAHLQKLGLTLHEEAEVTAVECGAAGYEVHLKNGQAIGADFVLNATGRPPLLEGLGLKAAGVDYSEKGIEVDEYLRSVSNRKIFAAGDAHSRMQLSPVANYEGDVVAHNILHGDTERVDYGAIPTTVFTVPPLADVGMTEDEARGKGLDIDVVTEDMSEWTVFRLAGEKPSYAKLIFEKRSGRMLGAHLFGPGADENIHVFAMAMRFGVSRRQLAGMIYVYPTFGSALKYLTPGS